MLTQWRKPDNICIPVLKNRIKRFLGLGGYTDQFKEKIAQERLGMVKGENEKEEDETDDVEQETNNDDN